MKKMFAVLLCALVVFTLACCNKDKADDPVLPPEAQNVFENTAFLNAFAKAIGKEPEKVTADDAEAIHYLSIYLSEDGGFELCVADKEASTLLFERKYEEFEAKIKSAKCDFAENENLTKDLGLFKNIKMFEFVDFPIADVSFVNNYQNLLVGVFNNNGITDVSSLSNYNPESLAELDFTGNNVHDWKPLVHIAEKVMVLYTSNMRYTLADFVGSAATNAENVEAPETQGEANKEENSSVDLVDENGAPVDFGALFD